ncbi:hypothetical protein AAFX91_00235 [Bradyrhizobium sp. 31Argb]|uniref:hypothetical protein n=1 Tax=Bradyrhizobium sp. 31Argb TaxID=3141247 RepID=UPI0037488084
MAMHDIHRDVAVELADAILAKHCGASELSAEGLRALLDDLVANGFIPLSGSELN